jgi:hypothetical protein
MIRISKFLILLVLAIIAHSLLALQRGPLYCHTNFTITLNNKTNANTENQLVLDLEEVSVVTVGYKGKSVAKIYPSDGIHYRTFDKNLIVTSDKNGISMSLATKSGLRQLKCEF